MSELTRRRLMTALPIIGAGALGVGFWKMLGGMGSGNFDPHAVNAPILNRPVPDFSLPGLPGMGDGFGSDTLKALTQPVLLNFFASWCIPCVAEMPELREIGNRIPIWGVAYKDKPEDSVRFVQRDGSPYQRVASDRSGLTAIDWGVTGVPESFLILPGGRIAWHGTAALSMDTLHTEIQPRLSTAEAGK
ncbi:redoxin domain-containing protein [Kozakia baliensis]|uniref:redoxin domain-containing protein n=1 Tax=Kozakia baliensis TaxID=153496 RepID=UPI00345BD430